MPAASFALRCGPGVEVQLTARSNTVVSIDMVSGSYAARPMPAAQSMLALPGIPSIRQLWSEGLLQLRPQKSIFSNAA